MSQKTASRRLPARAKPVGDAPEDLLSSLESMLAEIASERDARQRLISEAAPAAETPAATPSPADDTRIAALHAKIEKARAGLGNRDARIAALQAERDALRAELDKIRASRSWRITAPLRRLRGG